MERENGWTSIKIALSSWEDFAKKRNAWPLLTGDTLL